ncbi:MAG: ABC transporter permease [Bryobacteraceae bacterium]|nr:ABC transporter permease [Bryobacteraceae bacterium]
MGWTFAIRSLLRNKGFSALAIAILALGIGANAALFAVVYAVLLRPLDFPEPDRLADISSLWLKSGRLGTLSGPDFADIRDSVPAFESMAAYGGMPAGVTAGGAAYPVQIRWVTPGFGRVLGVAPARGRWFTGEEERSGGPPVVVVSAAFARRAFGGDALGATVGIDRNAATVVGVMPDGFRFPEGADLWVPHRESPAAENRTAHNWRAVARLKPGIGWETARAQLASAMQALARQYPQDYAGKSAAATPLKQRLTGETSATLWVLLAAVSLVLLIACANVANLLLARASVRQREMAIRAAVGASRGHLFRFLLAESAVLSAAAALAGLALAALILRVLPAVAPAGLPRLDEASLDPIVLLFTAGVAVCSTLLFGVLPAWRSANADLNDALKRGGRGTASSPLPGFLVVGEVALATVLTIGAGLLLRSFSGLLAAELGFESEKALVVEAPVPNAETPEGRAANLRFYDEVRRDLRSVPGVRRVAAVWGMPGQPRHSNGSYITGGGELSEARFANSKQALFNVISPDYFATMGIARLSGRDFEERDTIDRPFVAIVSQALARDAFPGRDPIGQQILCGLDSPQWMTIVGVVGDSLSRGPGLPPQPELYMPAAQHPGPGQWTSLVVRTEAEPQSLESPIRRIIASRNPEVPVKFSTIEATISDTIATPRFRTVLLGAFSVLALVLAMAGVYGVMAYAVTRRAAEFGIRQALGASRAEILAMVLRQGGTLALAGLVIGVAAAWAASRALSTMLHGVSTADFVTYAGAVVFLALAALAANLVPALRASRIDPAVALRAE